MNAVNKCKNDDKVWRVLLGDGIPFEYGAFSARIRFSALALLKL